MQMYNIHEGIIVMKCIDTRFFRNVFVLHEFYLVKSHSAAPPGFKPDKTLLLVF